MCVFIWGGGGGGEGGGGGAGHGFAGDLLAGGLNFQGVSPPSDACVCVVSVIVKSPALTTQHTRTQTHTHSRVCC